ncbi:MAG: carbon-nitrogen hydrolase family protein [Pseudomonadota bacterium]|mgnify:CR=1 FL=1
MKIAVGQTNSGIDPTENKAMLVAMAESASNGGARMLFTPEMSGLLDRDRARAAAMIMTEADDIVLAALCKAAADYHLWIAVGSLALQGERDDGRLVNRSFVIDDNGAIRARYDKLHLFDVDLATGESWRESARYAPGDTAIVIDTPVASLGLSVCYDLRFPALYTALSDAGAQLLAVPAAFTVPTGEAHWHMLLRARAIENAAYVIAAAQSGLHQDGRSTFGHSLVVDPWGRILLEMGQGQGVGFAEIDLDLVTQARSQIPVLDHRRPIPHVTHIS